MMKKIINSLSVVALVASLLAPISASAGSISVSAKVATVGGAWTSQVNATPGQDVLYSVTINNQTASTATGLAFRAVMPNGVSFVPGSAKLYYKDAATGTDKSMALSDTIATDSGASLLDIPSNYFVYVAYKVKVATSAANGSYYTSNQLKGSNGISVSANNGSIAVASVSGKTDTHSARVVSSLYNVTKGQTAYSQNVAANPGDELIYRMTITNTGTAAITNLNARAVLPNGISYVPGYAKLYYTENGVDKAGPLADGILNNGVVLKDLPVNNYFYVTYKVKVNTNAAAGTYYASNQILANNGISVSDNAGKISVAGVTPTPTPNPCSVPTGAAGCALFADATVVSSLYNVTKGQTAYSQNVAANPGDELIYRMTITNHGNTALTNLNARAVLPTGLEYVPGYAKLYYVENGIDKAGPLADGILNNGVKLRDLPINNYFYVTYKVRVSNSAASGVYYASNQILADHGVAESDNSGRISVTATENPVPPTPGVTRSMALTAVAYNATVGGNVPYKSTVTAKRGETVRFKIALNNTGNTDLENAKIAQSLPAYLSFVPGTAKVVSNGQVLTTADSVMTAGVNLGSARVGAGSYLEFEAVVKQDTPENTASLSYKATATADQVVSVSSLVTITVDGKTEVLPDTGTSGNILAIIVLALFLSTASYIYLKESGKLAQVASFIKK